MYIFGASSLAMSERGRVVTERAFEAACNNLIDIEPNALSEGDRHQNASQDIAKQPSSEKQDIPRLADPPSSKDFNDDKYIDQANLNRATLHNRGEADKEVPTQSTKLELNRSQKDEQEKNLTNNKELLTRTPSEGENEEGNYEELICLVRQFYVERPINPSAIAHQNIETC